MSDIASWLGAEAEDLLTHECRGIAKEQLHLPGSDFVDRVMMDSDRSPAVLRSMQTMFNHGRLGGTGYLSILPVDQGIEHSAGASFAPIRSTSIRPTLWSWRSRAGATPWRRPWAGCRRWRVAMLTVSR